MRIPAKLGVAALMAVALLMFIPGIASAHEEQEVGPVEMAVGFGTEPDAYAGMPNSVQVILHKDGKPVLDLGDSLTVTVEFGGEASDGMALEPFFEEGEFGILGDYRAFFVPSQPGSYTFHFTGTVDGTDIDESFTSGPQTFSDVKDIEGATFPAVQYPTNADLASRIEQESERTSTELAATTSDVEAANDAASSAKTVGMIGIVVGAIGVILAAVALATRKRS